MKINSVDSPRKPLIALLILSPAIAELLSGSSPPEKFFNPVTFLFLISLYGSGALLAREAWVRWGHKVPTLLLLGASYGVLEEGVVTRSFFCPTWPDLGPLAWYGYWLGVNWIWLVELTVFHAVFSITIPIILVELMYNTGRRPLLGKKGIPVAFISLGVVTLLGLMGFKCSIQVPLYLVILALLASISFIFLAKISSKLPLPPLATYKPIMIIAGALWGAFVVLSPYLLASAKVPPIFTLILELAVSISFIGYIAGRTYRGKDAYDVCTSPLWGLIVLAFLQGLKVTSMLATGIGFIVLIILMRHKVALKGWNCETHAYKLERGIADL